LGGAEGERFAVEQRSSENFFCSTAARSTLKSVRTPVARTLRVLNVSALHASTFKIHLSFPSEYL
jgi:hypothetical protein